MVKTAKTTKNMTRVKKAAVVPKKTVRPAVVREVEAKVVAKPKKEPIVSVVKLEKKIQTAEGWKRGMLKSKKKVTLK